MCKCKSQRDEGVGVWYLMSIGGLVSVVGFPKACFYPSTIVVESDWQLISPKWNG